MIDETEAMPQWLKRALMGSILFGVVALGGGGVYVLMQKAATRERLAKKNEAVRLIALADASISETHFLEAEDQYLQAASLLQDSDSLLADEIAKKRESIRSRVAAEQHKETERQREAKNQERERQREEERREQQVAARKARQQAEEQEARLVAQKAKRMYPKYKEAAELFADELLRAISAIEVGILYPDYTKRIQELQYAYNKLRMANMESTHLRSFRLLTTSFENLKAARAAWQQKIEAEYSSQRTEYETLLQIAWAEASSTYARAMAALAEGN